MLGAILDVLFPLGCAACRRRGWPFCARCWTDAVVLTPPGCRRCGRPFESGVESCVDCLPASVSWMRAPFLYEGPVRHALMRLKFGGLRSVAGPLAGAMVEPLAQCLAEHRWEPRSDRGDVPAVTWVPLAPRRRRRRGYDQAEILAREVAARAGLPVHRLLRRVVETAPQARRTGPDRRGALRAAFAEVCAAPPLVILVDDVVTTGATASECATVLLRAGAREVGVLSAARSLKGTLPARCYNPARASAWVCGCPGEGLPVVDASRRRNDPRKATLGR